MTQATCVLSECDRPRYGNGYCRRHNRLWNLYGDPWFTKNPPNIHTVEDGVGVITMHRRDGSQPRAFYDVELYDLVSAYSWYLSPHGYVHSTTGSTMRKKKTTALHRLVLGITTPQQPIVDHINGVRHDDRRCNLRIGEHQDNAVNRAVRNVKGTSAYRGVSWDRKREQWAAHVGLNYRLHHLGRYPTEEQAAAAVAKFRREQGLPAGY